MTCSDSQFETPNLASNKNLPYHDSRFRGYGGNKVIHALLLSNRNYEFKVLSNPFLIHNGIKEATSGRSLVEQKLNGKKRLIKCLVECPMNETKKKLKSEFLNFMKPYKLWYKAVAQINKNPYQFEFNPV